MYFVAIVLFVYNYFCFPVISLCDHCVVLVKCVADLFAMCECLLCVRHWSCGWRCVFASGFW